ncbi:Pectate lyase superfamily protein [Crateriforma conspicua]|uniref:Pectate lyase superfamily protein n=1 Tax=Crateriforma conspicua TaxID=2527996 RepID=A0A5C6FQ82_9PLAN|nr:glycosyl hydrolase family 28-related protein [Crateriforma conspicua]TWU64561.1 Pectate lyase superfamily protein [Crateriforma conspicua]
MTENLVLRLCFLLASVVLSSHAFAQPLRRTDAYGGVKTIKAEATDWFRVDDIGGRDYFITPDGHAFFSLGVTHSVECTRRDELNLFQTKYGNDEAKLADFFLQKFRHWGYNSSGYGPLQTMERRIPYVAAIPTIGPRSLSAGEKSKCQDLFDPAVMQRLRKRVRENCQRHVGNPFCLGYVFIDLPIWTIKWQGRAQQHTYLDFLRSLPDSAPGKQAYLQAFPQQEHADDLKAAEAFLNQIADRYYACITDELRKQDPNHLILGDRFMAFPERTPDSILVTASKYVDVLSFQPMGTRTMLCDYINHVHQLTGKPVLLADVNTMTRRPEKEERQVEEYQRSAGEHTMAYYLDAASSPHCIGLHRCTVRDYQPWNTQYHRRGLLKADDTEYPILVQLTQQTNSKVYDLVYGPQLKRRAASPKNRASSSKTSLMPKTSLVLRRELEKQYPESGFVQQGYLPVTLQGADPSGESDSTGAIQKTIDLAYEGNMVCYFPAGTYLVSRQLVCHQPRDNMTTVHVLTGSYRDGKRPVVRLTDSAPGFQDASSPRAVFKFQGFDAEGKERCPATYNQVFRGIDVHLGQGNAGAIGVYMHAAQGCTIQDVSISASGPFHAGIRHMVGSGAGYENIEVIGGKHAIDAEADNAKHPVVAGLRAIGQTEEIIKSDTATVLTIVGMYAEKQHGPCFTLARTPWRNECTGHLSLVDSVIKFTTPDQTLIDNRDRSVFLKNVYVRGAGRLVINAKGNDSPAQGNPKGWSQIEEYSYYHRPASRLIDGRGPEANDPALAMIKTTGISDDDVPVNMIARHVWDDATFPHFENPAVLSVTDAPFGAIPDDGADDTDAIQRAIDLASRSGKAVFLPKGRYRISRTIVLRKNTKLFGVSRNLSLIECMPDWRTDDNTPMIDTDDNATADTLLAFLRIEMPSDVARRIYPLRWRAGRHSMVREVWFRKGWGPVSKQDLQCLVITGNGGGRWYNLFHRAGQNTSAHPKHRYMLVEGTREPLNIYTYCVEYAVTLGGYQAEFNDARNVCLFGFKCETDLKKKAIVSTLGINDCQNILLTGNTGLASAPIGGGIIEVAGSEDITAANLARFSYKGDNSSKWYYIFDRDWNKGILESQPGLESDKTNNVVSLYKRGHCVPVPIITNGK